MNRINEYLEPGTYQDKDGMVVVLDVVTHTWNSVVELPEALPSPLVIVRDLNTVGKEVKIHKRMSYPLEVFKIKFKRV